MGSSSVQQALGEVCGPGDAVSEVWLAADDERFRGASLSDMGKPGAPDGVDRGARRFVVNYTPSRSHELPAKVKALFPDSWRRYLKVTIVRNPWDAIASRVHFMGPCSPGSFPKRALATLGDWSRLRRHWPGRKAHPEPYWWPWWSGEAPYHGWSGTPVADLELRFERLEDDFRDLCASLGVEAELPRLRPTARPLDRRRLYDERSRDAVARRFARVIERHGYTFD